MRASRINARVAVAVLFSASDAPVNSEEAFKGTSDFDIFKKKGIPNSLVAVFARNIHCNVFDSAAPL